MPLAAPAAVVALMRILLADDHALFRDGVASLVAAWGHTVVGQAEDGAQAIELGDGPAGPGPDGRAYAAPVGYGRHGAIKAADPGVAIVMLTVSEDEEDLFAAIKAGAQGYLLKNLESRELRACWRPSSAARQPSHRPRPGASSRSRGRSEGDAAAADEAHRSRARRAAPRRCRAAEQGDRGRLGISENTVKFHLKNIVEKLHARAARSSRRAPCARLLRA